MVFRSALRLTPVSSPGAPAGWWWCCLTGQGLERVCASPRPQPPHLMRPQEPWTLPAAAYCYVFCAQLFCLPCCSALLAALHA